MTLSMKRVDRVMVGVQTNGAPTPAEWDGWLALLAERPEQRIRVLIETHDGGGPNPTQRKQLLRVVKTLADVECALITESMVQRGIITAMSWLGIRMSAFNTDQYRAAFAHLGLSDDEVRSTRTMLDDLRLAAGIELPFRAALFANTPRSRLSLRRRSVDRW